MKRALHTYDAADLAKPLPPVPSNYRELVHAAARQMARDMAMAREEDFRRIAKRAAALVDYVELELHSRLGGDE